MTRNFQYIECYLSPLRLSPADATQYNSILKEKKSKQVN